MSDVGFHRIVVVGESGSGKTTLAGRLAALFGCEHLNVDMFRVPRKLRRRQALRLDPRIFQEIEKERWICDGLSDELFSAVEGHADLVVCLDYSKPTVMRRRVLRALREAFLPGKNSLALRCRRLRRQFLSFNNQNVRVLRVFEWRRQRRRQWVTSLRESGALTLSFGSTKEDRKVGVTLEQHGRES